VAAALLAVAALLLALRPESTPAGARAPTGVPVVVAAADLPAGTVLTTSDLSVTPLPPDVVPRGTTRAPDALVGRGLAGSVRAGEPLTDVRLVGAGLTALLAPDQVAAPVRLADLAVAALIRTGDKVDVLAIPPDGGAARVVAPDALVLASGSAPASPSATAPDPAAGLLLIAVDQPTAALLAAAAASSTLTVTLPRSS
jgi:Flp pilus assembly protein CpaB